jgi:hypothetical protein
MQEATTERDAEWRDHRLAAAFTAGRLAGHRQVATSLNPYDLEREPEEYAEWLRGHQTTSALHAAEALKARARTCRYRAQVCDCGGRGLCLDVA